MQLVWWVFHWPLPGYMKLRSLRVQACKYYCCLKHCNLCSSGSCLTCTCCTQLAFNFNAEHQVYGEECTAVSITARAKERNVETTHTYIEYGTRRRTPAHVSITYAVMSAR